MGTSKVLNFPFMEFKRPTTSGVPRDTLEVALVRVYTTVSLGTDIHEGLCRDINKKMLTVVMLIAFNFTISQKMMGCSCKRWKGTKRGQ